MNKNCGFYKINPCHNCIYSFKYGYNESLPCFIIYYKQFFDYDFSCENIKNTYLNRSEDSKRLKDVEYAYYIEQTIKIYFPQYIKLIQTISLLQ